MKILAIRGKNLASLDGEFEVDFRVEPLRSAGLFAITGSTGAGKSTILDALCLALFDDTPRFKNAGNVDILDASGKTVNQRNSGNILRKGTGEGYAEVEFVAINGCTYRSRWSIKRARGKYDGTLQNTELSLININDNTPCQGTKTEILRQITELIGLSFNQFTRAVLLAQGDFATFMKATDNEKAEILEKLTGTAIYTHISKSIYDNSKRAESEYSDIHNKLANVSLLTDEDLSALKLQRNDLLVKIEQFKKQDRLINNKLVWLKVNEQLQLEIKDTTTELASAKARLEESLPRHDYLSKIDKAQEIRDIYNQRENYTSQLSPLSKSLDAKRVEAKSISGELTRVGDVYDKSSEQLIKINAEYELVSPKIVKAREFDVQIYEADKNVKVAEKEIDAVKKKRFDLDKRITTLTNDIIATKDDIVKLSEWLNAKEGHSLIVSQYDFIGKLLSNYQTTKQQINNTSNLLRDNEVQLSQCKKHLEEQQQQLNSLNLILPDEVVNLRKKLVEGEPCPVCGSIHHYLHVDIEQSIKMQEEELDRRKRSAELGIEKFTKAIAEGESEITRLQTMVEGYKAQLSAHESELNNCLVTIPNWAKLNEEGKLSDGLEKLVKQWNEKTTKKRDAEIFLSELKIKIKAEQPNQADIERESGDKSAKFGNYNSIFAQLHSDRKALFDGRKADDVENEYKEKLQKCSKEKEQRLSEKNTLINKYQSIDGEINQMKTTVNDLNGLLTESNTKITLWLQLTNGLISGDLLKELLSRTMVWIEQERSDLSIIKDNIITIEAILNEKNSKFVQHQNSENSELDESVTIPILQDKLKAISENSGISSAQLSNLEFELKADITNRDIYLKYETECKAKLGIHKNWSKLNELLGSAAGDKFKKIAQCYTLDYLLAFANKHLEELTKRYKLQRIAGANNDGLGLQVVDNYNFGDVRSVHSLSGGESFLISLALALGLSSLSSNKMRIESLFIDEGFGSLDPDTLRVAMLALEHLQTQGRKIGVISHVQEMTEQIKVKIEVSKVANGRSKVITQSV